MKSLLCMALLVAVALAADCPEVDPCPTREDFSRDPRTGCPTCVPPRVECTPPETECTPGGNETDYRDENGCLLCRPPSNDCPRPTEPCGDAPPTTGDSGCPTCYRECTPPRECGTDESPRLDSNDCPTCRPRCDYESLRTCAEDERPEVDYTTGCPTCKPPPRDSPCEEADRASCRYDTLRECDLDAGERPVVEDCCLTCKVPPPSCADDAAVRCRERYSSLRACLADESPAFNRTHCCLTCRRTPPAGERPDSAGSCTLEAFRGCLLRAPTCEAGEDPVMPPRTEACCPSCVPPERRCRKIEVARCLSTRPVCEDGERPVPVVGECCPSCRRPRPTCDPACEDGAICVRTRDGPTCRPRRVIRRRLLAAAIADPDSRFADMTPEEARELVREIIERFCSKAENADRCEAVRDDIEAIVVRILTRAADGSREVEVDVPDAPPVDSTGRRLLALDDVVNDAFSDPYATEGFTVTESASGGTTDGTTDGSTTGEEESSGPGSSAACAVPAALAMAAAAAAAF